MPWGSHRGGTLPGPARRGGVPSWGGVPCWGGTLLQGSHFFPLTNFPDFSSVFFIFPWLLLNIFMTLFNTSTCTKILFLQYWEVRIFTLLHPKILSWNSNNSTLNTLWACSWDGSGSYTTQKREFWNSFCGKKFSNILILDWLNFNLWIPVFPDFSLTHSKFPDFLIFFQNSLTFPWLEKVVSFFQVFQCRWEPCCWGVPCWGVPCWGGTLARGYLARGGTQVRYPPRSGLGGYPVRTT